MSVNYILALRRYIRRRTAKARGGVIAVKIRDICVDDKRCEYVIYTFLAELVEKGVAQKRKQGVYLIDRAAVGLV